MSDELVVGLMWGVLATTCVFLWRNELWDLACRTKHGLFEIVPFVSFLGHGVVSRWRLVTLNKRRLERHFNSVYYCLDESLDEAEGRQRRDHIKRTMDGTAAEMARSGCNPFDETKRRMVENGHHDRFYWNGRDIEWPSEDEVEE